MLELKSISYSVQESTGELGILKDISLTIDDHRLVVFTGPNGGGKTTLAKIIMGLATPTSGQLYEPGHHLPRKTWDQLWFPAAAPFQRADGPQSADSGFRR